MSLAQRLFNIARAELNSAQTRIVDKISSLSSGYKDKTGVNSGSDEEKFSPQDAHNNAHQEKLRQYYANLELPDGADWPQVKSAYRRLMRKYHPDRHRDNPEQQRISTELTQKLRVAYEALRKELKA